MAKLPLNRKTLRMGLVQLLNKAHRAGMPWSEILKSVESLHTFAMDKFETEDAKKDRSL